MLKVLIAEQVQKDKILELTVLSIKIISRLEIAKLKVPVLIGIITKKKILTDQIHPEIIKMTIWEATLKVQVIPFKIFLNTQSIINKHRYMIK